MKIGDIWNATVRIHFLTDVFGFLSYRHFATMATWHNVFSSLLRKDVPRRRLGEPCLVLRVTWSEEFSSRIRHRNASTEKAWEDALQRLGKGELTFHSFPCKTGQIFYMRNQQLTGLEGHPFVMIWLPSDNYKQFAWLPKRGQLGQREVIRVCASSVGSGKWVNFFLI